MLRAEIDAACAPGERRKRRSLPAFGSASQIAPATARARFDAALAWRARAPRAAKCGDRRERALLLGGASLTAPPSTNSRPTEREPLIWSARVLGCRFYDANSGWTAKRLRGGGNVVSFLDEKQLSQQPP